MRKAYRMDGERVGSRGPTPRPVLDRILDRVEINGADECWPMSGVSSDGYAVIGVGSKADGSRRSVNGMSVVYDAVVGDRREGEVTDHLCRNRRCVNPDHLEMVSSRVNVMRGESIPACRARRNVCEAGHELSGEKVEVVTNGGRSWRVCRVCYPRQRRSNVSADEQQWIEEKHLEGWPNGNIAEVLGLDKSSVSHRLRKIRG